jgi:hypothetical protein
LKSKYLKDDSLLPTTINLLCVLEEKKIIRLKRNSSRNTKYLDQVFKDFKKISEQNKEIKYYESVDGNNIVVMFDINYQVSSFII